MEEPPATAKPAKVPLPGYRFLFMALGLILSIGGLFAMYAVLFAGRQDEAVHRGGLVFALLFTAGWLVAGIACILFSLRLRKGNLAECHWMFGLALMIICAVLIGLFFKPGYIFLFMALIWTDSDVKTHFR